MLPSRFTASLKRTAVFLLIAALLTACGSSKSEGNGDKTGETDGNKIVAVYTLNADTKEEQNITQAEFDAFIGINKLLNPMFAYYEQDPSFREEMLKQHVAFRVFSSRIEGQARADAEKIAEEDLKAFLAALEEGMGGKEGMDEQLKELSVTQDDIKNYIHMYSLATEHLQSLISDDQAKQEFDQAVAEDPNAFVTIGTVSHVLIGTVDPQTQEEKRTNEEALERAEEVRAKLLGGADFSATAKEYSDDEGSIENGGTYKDWNLYQFVEEFRDAALELPLHQISEPVETMYGYHIIRVDDRKVPGFDEVKDQIVNGIMQQKFSEFMDDELPKLLKETHLPKAEPDDAAPAQQ